MSEACVILNDIYIGIVDYIKPAYCNEAQVSDRIPLVRRKRLIEFLPVPKHVDRIPVGEQSECLNNSLVCPIQNI